MTWRRAALVALPWAVVAIGVAYWVVPFPAAVFLVAVAAAGFWHRSWRVAGLVFGYLAAATGVFLTIFAGILQGKQFMAV